MPFRSQKHVCDWHPPRQIRSIYRGCLLRTTREPLRPSSRSQAEVLLSGEPPSVETIQIISRQRKQDAIKRLTMRLSCICMGARAAVD